MSSDSLLRHTARARPRKVPRRIRGDNKYAKTTNTMRLFLAMALVAGALFFALATMLHGGGLDAAERGDFFAHDEAAHGLHALRRNRAPPAAVEPPIPAAPRLPPPPRQPRYKPAADAPQTPRYKPAATADVDDAPAPPPKLDAWEDPVLRKDDAAIASALARPKADPDPRRVAAEAAALRRRAFAMHARTAVEAEMAASAGPPDASKTGAYQPWALDAKHQRWRLQAMHPGRDPSALPADAWIARAVEARRSIQGAPPLPRTAPPLNGDSTRTYEIAGAKRDLPDGEPDSTIFIVTASYRDPEVASTIARAFIRAAHPERIVVGVHAQNAEGEDEPERDPIAGLEKAGVTCPGHPVCDAVLDGRVRVSRQLWSRAEGPTVARHYAEKHFRNESYVMGVDSHCHFVRGWDNVQIDMFRRIGNDHAIITAYPASYGASNQGGDGSEAFEPPTKVSSIGCIRRTRRVNVHNTISFKHDMSTCATPVNGPSRVAFFAAGFSFARGHRILRVPYDWHTPYIFDGEEISLGVRAWTWGYDLYQPDRNIIGHLYIPSGSSLRPVFWTTDWGKRWPCQYRSLLRIQEQLGVHAALTPRESLGPVDRDDWASYAAGPRRTAAQFFEWAKVPVVNEWGDKCAGPSGRSGRQFCFTADLAKDFKEPGGMPYVPWLEGTGAVWPPLVKSAQYPPPVAEHWRGTHAVANVAYLAGG